ncbi:hypothetical protein G5V57_13110 [Nordella sp. HKS 07]|uniref:hypothetical protein n=1 Tax=Nordella sp. HKS 07 TaxID=2712222 RepID=UPI0013E1F907|nr:hypothetical protein [Nordella sp. HKS 07]QIG48582.1 hypothetical protein G5V57_13110 [Nordella sp. HKS 07]
MASLKSFLPFWRKKISGSEAGIPAAPPDNFGAASSFELQFDRLMDDPAAPRDALFPVRSCRG